MKIKDVLHKNRNSNKIAVIYKDCKYTYNDIYNQVVLHTGQLINFKSRNVGIFVQNSVNYVIAYFSVAYLDRVIIPIDVNSRLEQILRTIAYCELELVITDNQYFEYLSKVMEEGKQKIVLYNLDNPERCYIYEGTKEGKIGEKVDPGEDVAIMLHTSGTTSNPKKVMLTHDNLISNIKSNIESLALTENDRSLIVLPMYFGYCNTSQFLTHFYLGGSIVIYDGTFVPRRFIFYIEKYMCTNTTCVPSMLYLLVKGNRSRYELPLLRYLCFGGGNISNEILLKTIDMLPNTGIVQTYGQTEASPRVTCLLPEDSLRKLGSVGKTIPGVSVKIFDEHNMEVNEGVEGEIVVRGKNVMKGYYKHQDITEKVIVDGWLHTGDIGRIDSEGYLYIVGRIKNIIISGGLNIYPEEIEEVLRTHPSIAEAYVFSKKHVLLGEVPAARVVTYKDEKLNVKEIQKYCKKKLEIQKVPSVIEIVDKIEKTYSGKIRRNQNE